MASRNSWLKREITSAAYKELRILNVSDPFPKNAWFTCRDILSSKCDIPHCDNNNIWFRFNDDGSEWFLCKEHGPDEGILVMVRQSKEI